MSTRKAIVIRWLQVPPKAMPPAWPEHKIPSYLARNRIRTLPMRPHMLPLRPHPHHELSLPRDRPRLLKEQVSIPLLRVLREERRDSTLNLQPMFDRSY